MKSKLIKIEGYGRRYIEVFLNIKKNKISKSPLASLEFFLSKSFYRGRKDELSNRFELLTKKILQQHYQKYEFGELSNFDDQLKKGGVNNQHDRKMVIETIKFVYKLPDKNLTNYAVDLIKNKRVKSLFDELLKIHAIGPKLAGLYIRDLIFLFNLEKFLKEGDYIYCQPVDTWVKQVAVKLSIAGNEDSMDSVAEKIIKFCLENKISPLLFNAGAWYVGARAFDLLLDSF